MDKRIITLILSVLMEVQLFAQNTIQSINEIKYQSDTYLYAESTSATLNEAFENAKILLGIEIETWVKSQENQPAEGYIAEAQKHIYELNSTRGNLFRAFVYVKKTDIIPVSNANQFVVVPINKNNETTVNEIEEHRSEISTITEEPIEEPLITYQPSEFDQEMMSVVNAKDIGSFIKRLKADNKVAAFGKYKDMPSDINCYLFVYNRDLIITAHLYKNNNTYLNLKTGNEDYLVNYKGCGALWFQLK